MSSCLPDRYRLQDLGLALLGACSLLTDAAADLWVAAGYVRQGERLWAALLLALLCLSSVSAQIFSWAWYQADRRLLRGEEDSGGEGEESGGEAGQGLCLADFTSYRLLSSNRCLALLHLLQLGFLLRYVHMLEVGFRAYRKGSPYHEYKDYAYFLTHDISMLRLFETFIENTPQLALVLYIVLSTDEVGVYQYVSISVSFFSIAWAVQDYHQSLRFFLKDKHKLSFSSSILYFIWNLVLICPRILSIALFAAIFQYYIFVHFLLIWVALQVWVWLQQTDFMKMPVLEPFYRAAVAVILYFSWFNVADGKTVCRSLIYYTFIIIDSSILFLSWWYYRDPLTTDHYALPVLITTVLLFTVGLIVRCVYYKWFHPKSGEPKIPCDEVDHGGKINNTTFRSFPSEKTEARVNPRMRHLSQNVYSASYTAYPTNSQPLMISAKNISSNGH